MGSILISEKTFSKDADVDGDGQICFLEFANVNRAANFQNLGTVVNPENMEQGSFGPPKPPDGGWGWVIVFSCFMCNFIVGNQYSCNSIVAEVSQQMASFLIDRLHDHTIETYAIY